MRATGHPPRCSPEARPSPGPGGRPRRCRMRWRSSGLASRSRRAVRSEGKGRRGNMRADCVPIASHEQRAGHLADCRRRTLRAGSAPRCRRRTRMSPSVQPGRPCAAWRRWLSAPSTPVRCATEGARHGVPSSGQRRRRGGRPPSPCGLRARRSSEQCPAGNEGSAVNGGPEIQAGTMLTARRPRIFEMTQEGARGVPYHHKNPPA